jgi:hypothetical protein
MATRLAPTHAVSRAETALVGAFSALDVASRQAREGLPKEAVPPRPEPARPTGRSPRRAALAYPRLNRW